MPTYIGKCSRCPTEIHKYVKPGKEPLCLPCGIAKAISQQREMHEQRGEGFQRAAEGGREMAYQYQRREGEWYEKWREGMQRYVERSFPTKDTDSATVTATKPPGRSRRTRRK